MKPAAESKAVDVQLWLASRIDIKKTGALKR
jgi:hypothetical protein